MNLKLNHSTEDEVLMCVAAPVDTTCVCTYIYYVCALIGVTTHSTFLSNELFVIILKYDTEFIQSTIQFLQFMFLVCCLFVFSCYEHLHVHVYYQ